MKKRLLKGPLFLLSFILIFSYPVHAQDNTYNFSISKVYPNPSPGEAFVNVYTAFPRKISMEYVNTMGQVFNGNAIELQPGSTRIPLKVNASAGNFIVRFRDKDGIMLGYQRFIKY